MRLDARPLRVIGSLLLKLRVSRALYEEPLTRHRLGEIDAIVRMTGDRMVRHRGAKPG
jgi:hypothetical protein